MRKYDTIVVGLGAMGSATLYHLAKRGQKVLGLEQFSPGHTLGSSHGDSRIIREQYFEHPLYVPLVQRAFQLWRELEQTTDRELMTITGGLMIGPRDGSVVTGTLRSAIEHHLPHELLSPADVHARFPAFTLAPDLVATFDARAGVLDADACNAAHIEAARAAGAEARFNEPVTKWEADSDGVRVTTPTGTYSANRLLLTAGPWTNEMLSDLELPLTVEREVVFWFDPVDDPTSYDKSSFPIFCHEYTPGHICFGASRTERGVKAAIHHTGEYVARPRDVKRDVGANEVDALRVALSPVLPGLSRAAVRESGVCLYTNTPDDNFIIDWHPRHEQVLVSSPCSGHGFKFASVLGEVQADLLTGGKCAFDISPFRIGSGRRGRSTPPS
jgi:sarcosine oxidase